MNSDLGETAPLDEEHLREIQNWRETGAPLPEGKYALVIHKIKAQCGDTMVKVIRDLIALVNKALDNDPDSAAVRDRLRMEARDALEQADRLRAENAYLKKDQEDLSSLRPEIDALIVRASSSTPNSEARQVQSGDSATKATPRGTAGQEGGKSYTGDSGSVENRGRKTTDGTEGNTGENSRAGEGTDPQAGANPRTPNQG